jgi:hypothetical protein
MSPTLQTRHRSCLIIAARKRQKTPRVVAKPPDRRAAEKRASGCGLHAHGSRQNTSLWAPPPLSARLICRKQARMALGGGLISRTVVPKCRAGRPVHHRTHRGDREFTAVLGRVPIGPMTPMPYAVRWHRQVGAYRLPRSIVQPTLGAREQTPQPVCRQGSRGRSPEIADRALADRRLPSPFRRGSITVLRPSCAEQLCDTCRRGSLALSDSMRSTGSRQPSPRSGSRHHSVQLSKLPSGFPLRRLAAF